MKPIPANKAAASPDSANNKTDKLHSLRQRRPFIVAILLTAVATVPCYGDDHSSSGDAVIDSDESPAWRSNVYVTWASDYVYRGVSLTDFDPAWQAGADIAHRSGVFAGVWTSAIDYEANTEHNIFAGYSRNFGLSWTGSVRLTHFDFRGGQVGPDNTFNQWQVDVQYNRATTLRIYQTDNTYGMRFASNTVELQHVVPIADHWLLSGLFGQWDLEKLAGDHYNYMEFAGSWSTQRVNLSLQYHHADSRGRKVYGEAAQPGWLMSATYRIF